MNWVRIDEQLPEDGQKVFYYFGFFDEVYEGFYQKGEELECNIFYGKSGFLGDDVTYWMARNDGDTDPPHPTDDQKLNDLYHPRKDGELIR